MSNQVLTRASYWAYLPNSTKSYWQKLADRNIAIICTHRASSRTYQGETRVRIASTTGKFGKAAKIVNLDILKMLNDGYVWRSYP
jgi:hypothetical protein